MLRCLRDIRCVRYVIIAVFGNVVGSLFLPKPRAKVQQFSHIHKQKGYFFKKRMKDRYAEGPFHCPTASLFDRFAVRLLYSKTASLSD